MQTALIEFIDFIRHFFNKAAVVGNGNDAALKSRHLNTSLSVKLPKVA